MYKILCRQTALAALGWGIVGRSVKIEHKLARFNNTEFNAYKQKNIFR